jgi:hypothetical protein
MDYSDHYRAVPLSDGYHILFTDPSTGLLCLGSDAPVGGPTKLLRKIWFQGPDAEGSPVAYASGSDLGLGVRVVAGFGSGTVQRIWFFSVPGDVFAANSQSIPRVAKSSRVRPSFDSQAKNVEWMNWWPEDGLQEWLSYSKDSTSGVIPRSIWPVKIKGQEIGTLPGLVDLAIDSGPRMTIWAFSSKGVAKVWQLDDGSLDSYATERLIARDGTVRELDVEGDVEMIDAPASNSVPTPDVLVPALPPDTDITLMESNTPFVFPYSNSFSSPASPQESFDGTASFIISSSITRIGRRYRIHNTNYNLDANFLMDDSQDSDPAGGDSRGSIDQASVCGFVSGLDSGDEFVNEFAGIARMDIEIL